jgi:hypothetical protein
MKISAGVNSKVKEKKPIFQYLAAFTGELVLLFFLFVVKPPLPIFNEMIGRK